MGPSRCACDPPEITRFLTRRARLRADEMRRAGRLREAAVASAARLNPSVRCMSPDTACRDAPEESAELTYDAIGAFHRAWDEKRMQFRRLVRVGQLVKGAATSPARISQRTEI